MMSVIGAFVRTVVALAARAADLRGAFEDVAIHCASRHLHPELPLSALSGLHTPQGPRHDTACRHAPIAGALQRGFERQLRCQSNVVQCRRPGVAEGQRVA